MIQATPCWQDLFCPQGREKNSALGSPEGLCVRGSIPFVFVLFHSNADTFGDFFFLFIYHVHVHRRINCIACSWRLEYCKNFEL